MRTHSRSWLGLLASACWLAGGGAFAQVPEAINPGTPWPATDELGRSLPLAAEVGPIQSNRFVGIFYFLTHSEGPNPAGVEPGPLDVAKILARDPQALKKPDSPLWGGIGASHYWGQPLYGYYRSNDPWVIRRHAYLLADAGIDTLIFDTTNAQTYREIYLALCQIFREVRQAGGRTPQIAFMVNTQAGETGLQLYNDLYKPGLYQELWFRWQGKPLLICDPEKASSELKAFFTLRRAHWPFTMTNTASAWHWEATYPQPYGYTDDPSQPEQVNVSVAQNLRAKDGKVTNMSSGEARGRSFHEGSQQLGPGSVNLGHNFQEQWKRAFELKPPFVMVTGWNEWTAGRWKYGNDSLVFVDQFDEEYSRDIEPMQGGHTDNYYWQLIANVRRFRGAPALPKASAPTTIHLEAGAAQWSPVAPEFTDSVGDVGTRNFGGVAGLHYTNASGRNDLVACKVARDKRNLYFYVRTQAPLSAPSGSNWMWLLLDTDQNPATGWAGYDFIVNRSIEADGSTWLEQNLGGWDWKKVAKVQLQLSGKELQLSIPRSALGLAKGKTRVAIDFKWADNLQKPGDVMDFFLSGDVAPEGRFNYRYSGD